VKFAPKRFATKWISIKMGNAKKGHNKTDHAKVVALKRRASKPVAKALKIEVITRGFIATSQIIVFRYYIANTTDHCFYV